MVKMQLFLRKTPRQRVVVFWPSQGWRFTVQSQFLTKIGKVRNRISTSTNLDTLTESDAFWSGAKQKVAQLYRGQRGPPSHSTVTLIIYLNPSGTLMILLLTLSYLILSWVSNDEPQKNSIHELKYYSIKRECKNPFNFKRTVTM